MCEECESNHERSRQPDKVMGQSIVSEIKTEVPLENDDPAYQNFLLQRYEERTERLSQTDKVSKFCMDAGFLSVVEIGQCFMTKDNEEQFYAMACREYEDEPEELALQLNVKDFACRSKAKAKPQRKEPASYSPSIIPMNERNWIDIEPPRITLSLCVRSFEESNPSSSTFSTSSTRR